MAELTEQYDFSVLMACCASDSAEYLNQAIESIWTAQDVKPAEVILVVDGNVPLQITDIIAHWKRQLADRFRIVSYPERKGLAYALNIGLKYCNSELIARMDADDISLPNRFSIQVPYMVNHPQTAVCSSWVEEFNETFTKSLGIRKLPESNEQVRKFAKKRNPVSHPAAMFRKNLILELGGYPLFAKAQDYALWSLVLQKGFIITNIPQILVNMRAGKGLFQRRGLSYFKNEVAILKYQREIGFISSFDFITNYIARRLLRTAPDFIKKIVYGLR
jgi:glycosyltransferase involved in cell wall biosynthesis